MFRECVQGRETDPAARSLVAIATAWTIAVVVEVGTFASRWVDHVAERDLLTVAPPLFLVFGLWLRRGLPRAGPGARLRPRQSPRRPSCSRWRALRCPRLPSMRSASSPSDSSPKDVDRDVGAPLPLAAAGLVAVAILVPRRAGCPAGTRRGRARFASILSTREIDRLSALERAWVFDSGDPRRLDAVADEPVTYLHGSAFPAGAWKHVVLELADRFGRRSGRRGLARSARPGGARGGRGRRAQSSLREPRRRPRRRPGRALARRRAHGRGAALDRPDRARPLARRPAAPPRRLALGRPAQRRHHRCRAAHGLPPRARPPRADPVRQAGHAG